jgi:predicted DNA-binding transcriptional regulator AlpA
VAARTESINEFLTLQEVAAILKVESRTIQRLIDSGEFPDGLQATPGVKLWPASDPVNYVGWLAMLPRMVPKSKMKKVDEDKKPD